MEDKEKIQFVGIKPTRSLFRYVELQVEKWISRERSLLFLPKSADYKVRVERDKAYPHYQCNVEVRIGSKRWHSFECGRTLHDTLNHALRHMRLITTLPQRHTDLAADYASTSNVA
ncbi:MAG: hypothetical protein AB7F43_04865 [Bacteriovoracia bacterium]